MEKLLTFSIAAYNVENYLDQLMESLLNSDRMEQIEVLIVDDGSKDKTAEKGLSYQNRWPDSVRLISKQNGGHGSTINQGIKEATGKYFRALDGDDWINPDNLKRLIDKLDSINADIILSDYCSCYEDGRNEVSSEFRRLEEDQYFNFSDIIRYVSWMRYHTLIYRTSILQDNNIRLDEHCFYVDAEFDLYPIPYVQKVYYAKDYIYCYRLGLTGQSVSTESRMKHIDNSLTVSKHLIEFWGEVYSSLDESHKTYIRNGIAKHCLWHIRSLFLFPLNKKMKKELVSFEKYTKERSPEIYAEIGRRSKVLTVLRKTNYLPYKPICWFSKRKLYSADR